MPRIQLARRAALAGTLVAAAAIVTPTAADAHVTVHPNSLPAGGYTVVNIRVPNERDKTRTTKVEVQFPAGFYSVSTAAQLGWNATVSYRKLSKPVTIEGRQITQEVSTVSWKATGAGIKPGQFLEFPLSVAVPDTVKQVLTFKALQTYSNGEVVRWIGPPSADEPAPQVMTVAKNKPLQDFPGGITAVRRMASAPATAPRTSFASFARQAPVVIRERTVYGAWTFAALGIGIAGVLIGAAGLRVGLRRTHA